MHTFAQKLFFMFGLRCRTTRRTPAALQVDRVESYFAHFRGPQRPCRFRIGTELRGGGLLYVKPLANAARMA